MCGILGVIHFGDQLDHTTGNKFIAGLGLMRGRGPDGYGIYADHDVLLGQTSLAITDPEGRGQPYVSNDLNIIACANGEIYNAPELRIELERAGARFCSDSDCEVIAHGYALWGDKLFERLDGMFALAVFSRTDRVLKIARDRVGIRPLYYTRQGNYVAFASEPRMLIAAGLASSDPCEEGLFHSLTLRRPLEPLTMYKEVKAVLPGRQLTIDSKGHYAEHVFAVPPSQSLEPAGVEHGHLDTLRRVVTRAVSRRVPEKCKYSLFLSGGLDSTIVNLLTPNDPTRRLPSVVSGFSFDHLVDERLMAQKAAHALQTELATHTVTMEHFLAMWPLLVWINSEPLMFNSSVPLFLLCRNVRAWGAKVMLSGEGADEMFLGYSQYPAYAQHQDDGSPEYLLRHDEEILATELVLQEWVQDRHWGQRQWQNLRHRIDTAVPFRGKQHGLARKVELDRISFMRGLLMRQDRVGLTTGIEIRVPFLDQNVLREANRYTTDWHLRDGIGKRLLRDAFEPYLGELARVPKIGFPVPVDTWLTHEGFKTVCRRLNQHLNQTGLVREDAILSIMQSSTSYPKNSYRRMWTLLNLAMWWVTRSSPPPPYGIWEDLIPSEQHSYVAGIVADTKHSFVPGFLAQRITGRELPVIVNSDDWVTFNVSYLQEYAGLPA